MGFTHDQIEWLFALVGKTYPKIVLKSDESISKKIVHSEIDTVASSKKQVSMFGMRIFRWSSAYKSLIQ